MARSVADVTESLLDRFDGLLPLDVVSELVRNVRVERGLGPGEPVDAETEALLLQRLERLHRARVPAARVS